MQRLVDRINALYVVWLLALSAVAFCEPRTMLWFDQRWVFWSLAVSMLGMGLSLSLDDFRAVGRMPGRVALGFCLQYTVMPLGGWFVATLLGLDIDLKAGLVLVASCPGGMASNMIAFLARADVALSVVLTLCSTMLAFLFTPLWTTLLVGRLVPVDAAGLCLSALQLTVAPVAAGVLLRWLLPRTADRLGACGPTIAMLAFVSAGAGNRLRGLSRSSRRRHACGRKDRRDSRPRAGGCRAAGRPGLHVHRNSVRYRDPPRRLSVPGPSRERITPRRVSARVHRDPSAFLLGLIPQRCRMAARHRTAASASAQLMRARGWAARHAG
jgi:hypothetical protein